MALGDLIARLRIDSKQFDTNIRKSTAEIRQIEREGKKLNADLNKVGSAFKKIAPMVGLATTAIETLKATIKANEYIYDQFQSEISASKAVIDSFFSSIANGSFDNFVRGMDSVVKSAKELYSALDALETFRIYKVADTSNLEKQIEEALTVVKQAGKKDENGLPLVTDEAVKAAKERLNDLSNEYNSMLDKEARYAARVQNDRVNDAAQKIKLDNQAQINDLRMVWDDWDLYEEWSKWLDDNKNKFNNLATQGILNLSDADKAFREMYKYRRKIVGTVESDEWKAYKNEITRLNSIAKERERLQQRINRAENTAVDKTRPTTTDNTNKALEDRLKIVNDIEKTYLNIKQIQDKMISNEEFHFNVDLEADVQEPIDEIRKKFKQQLDRFNIKLDVDVDTLSLEDIYNYSKNLNNKHIKLNIDTNSTSINNVENQIDGIDGKHIKIFVDGESKIKFDTKEFVDKIGKEFKDFKVKFNPDKTSLQNISDYFNSLKLDPSIDDKQYEQEAKRFKDKVKEYFSSLSITPDIDIDTSSLEEVGAYLDELSEKELSLVDKIGKEFKDFKVKFNPDKTSLQNIRDYFNSLKLDPSIDDKQYEQEAKRFKDKVKEYFSSLSITPDIDIDTSSLEEVGAYLDELSGQEISISLDNLTDEQLKQLASDLKLLQDQMIATSGDYYANINSNVLQQIKEFKTLGELAKIEPVEIIVESIVDEEDAIREEDELNAMIVQRNDLLAQSIANGRTYGEVMNAIDLTNQISQLSTISSIAGSLGDTFVEIGNALDSTSGDMLAWAGKQVAIIGELATKYAAVAAAKAAGETPFPANLVAITSTVGAIIAAVASLPKFEYGGMVKGTSYKGDNILARLNSGERVLTMKQNDKFEKLLENYNGLGSGNVEFIIHGRDLKGVLNNYDNYNSTISKR